MKSILKKSMLALIVVLTVVSCRPRPEEDDSLFGNGVLVLSEGLYGTNGAVLSYYDIDSNAVTYDIFNDINGRSLGDVGNDMQLYGAKLYIVVNNSNTVEVVDINNGKSLSRISLVDKDGIGMMPRRIAFNEGKAYVCCYNGEVVRIDTTSLQVEATAQAGKSPEALCISNGKLFVSNSGGLDYPNYDSTVSVIDLNTFTEVEKIVVRLNPGRMGVDSYGNVYVLSVGDYAAIMPCIQKISATDNQLVATYEVTASNFTIYNDAAYAYGMDNTTYAWWFKKIDLLTGNTSDIATNGTNFIYPYAINVDADGNVYIGDAGDFKSNGDVYCFGSNGTRKYSFEAGVGPNTILKLK